MTERLQIIWTPWRNHTELMNVREWFFPVLASGEQRDSKSRRKACDQVSLNLPCLNYSQLIDFFQVSTWKLRGNLPHAVESTWLLTEAILIDEKPVEQMPVFAIKAAYITAISRSVLPGLLASLESLGRRIDSWSSFVTGLLDSQQESKYKVSMYTQAQKVGLPALFVDIRHEATHGDMPNLTNLRSAADRALKWLWDDYWKDLERKATSVESADLKTVDGGEHVRENIGAADEEEQPGGWQPWQGRWTPKPIGTI